MQGKNKHNKDGATNVQQVISAVTSFMKTKVITSENDKVGIVLYGTEKTNNNLGIDNIFVLNKLDAPDARAKRS